MQNYFAAPEAAAQSFSVKTCQFFCDGGDGAIRSGDEYNVCGEQGGVQTRQRAAGTDGAGGGTGVLLGAADDGADAPASLVEAAAESAADASCADDG
jgi:hypothetical protein